MQDLQKFDQLKADISIYLKPVNDLVVNSQDTQDSVTKYAKEIKSYSKKVEEKRKELVEPLNAVVKEINAYAKDLMMPLENAETKIKTMLLSWNRELEKIRAAEMKKAEDARIAAEIEAKKISDQERANAEFEKSIGLDDQAVLSEMKAEVIENRELKSVDKEFKTEIRYINEMRVKGIKKNWKIRIVDDSKIPRKYLSVNETMLKKDLMDLSEDLRPNFKIDGVEFYQEESMSI